MDDGLQLPTLQDADFEPKPHEREFYLHKATGNRGYMVREAGKTMIRLDRGPNVRMLVPFHDKMWAPVGHSGLMTRPRGAKVAFEADKELCVILGKPQSGTRDWASLSMSERAAWAAVPTFNNPIRDGLYRVIMDYLKPYMSG